MFLFTIIMLSPSYSSTLVTCSACLVGKIIGEIIAKIGLKTQETSEEKMPAATIARCMQKRYDFIGKNVSREFLKSQFFINSKNKNRIFTSDHRW